MYNSHTNIKYSNPVYADEQSHSGYSDTWENQIRGKLYYVSGL